MKIGYASSPYISNTTGDIFFKTAMSGISQMYRLTVEGWPYQLTIFDDGIEWYDVSPGGHKAIVGASIGGNEDAQLYLLDIGTGRISQLTNDEKVRYGTIFWRQDESGLFYTSNVENKRDFKIYSHSLTTGERTLIFDKEGNNAISDVSGDGTLMLVRHLVSNYASQIYLVNLLTGENRMIASGGEETIYDYPVMMPDKRTVYLISNDNPEGILKLARFDIETGALEFIDPDSPWPVDYLEFSPDRRYMAWLINENGYMRLRLRDMILRQPVQSPPMDGIIQSPVLTDDGKVIFQFNSPTQAPDIWLWNWREPELTKVTHSINAGIDMGLFVEPELIKYKSFDGLEIPAFLYLPPDYDGSPIPFIIHVHGGPESQFQPFFQRHFNYLLLNGYGILAPNIRGSSGYGKEYLNLDNYKNRINSIRDIKAGVDYLIEKNYTSRGQIGIKGASYGGYVVLASIAEYPDLFSAAIDQVGIANFVTFLENTRSYRRNLREAEYGPLDDTGFLESISPIHRASRIKTPLLVIHGENDPRVPIDEARQIINAVNESGGIADSLIFPDEGHGVGKLENRLTLYRKMVEFFDKYLKR
nr:S9 family peptidase [candidate division Zixibacteria bacterium]